MGIREFAHTMKENILDKMETLRHNEDAVAEVASNKKKIAAIALIGAFCAMAPMLTGSAQAAETTANNGEVVYFGLTTLEWVLAVAGIVVAILGFYMKNLYVILASLGVFAIAYLVHTFAWAAA